MLMHIIKRRPSDLGLATLGLFMMFSVALTVTNREVLFFKTSCDTSSLLLTIAFPVPFTGSVFVVGYQRDPDCIWHLDSPVTKHFLNISLTMCGNNVVDVSATGYLVLNSIGVKYDDGSRVYDYTIVGCRYPRRSSSPYRLSERIGEANSTVFTLPYGIRRIVALEDGRRLGEVAVNHSISKRETRKNFLRATIAALASKLLINRQPRADTKESGFEKRIAFTSDNSSSINSTTLRTDGSLAFNQTLTVEIATLFPNIQVHVVNNTDGYDYTDNYDITESEGKVYDDSLTQKLNDTGTDSEHFKHSLFDFAHFSTIKVPQVESIVYVNNATGDDLEQKSEHLTTTESNKTSNDLLYLTDTVANSTILANLDTYTCIPRIRFIVLTVVVAFTVISLLLLCCGMVLYIRKEKKKRLIDNFLLYSF